MGADASYQFVVMYGRLSERKRHSLSQAGWAFMFYPVLMVGPCLNARRKVSWHWKVLDEMSSIHVWAWEKSDIVYRQSNFCFARPFGISPHLLLFDTFPLFIIWRIDWLIYKISLCAQFSLLFWIVTLWTIRRCCQQTWRQTLQCRQG